ncbi:MAG: amino acid adenylation domain-containing protein, partial [bacterium]|nr:amino acid adenylation domain-containing protein [bacterium]
FKVTHINFVPAMFSVFTDHLTPQNICQLSGLKYIFLAGETLPAELAVKFRQLGTGIRLENLYGPTEATVYASFYSLEDWKDETAIPIGKPLSNVRLFILDRYDNLQSVGIPGELCIAGTGIAGGYLNRPELTKETFEVRSVKSEVFSLTTSLYHTGDLARWLPDGNIEFLSRIDQ